MITGDNYMNGPNFYLTLTPDERHDLLKLTVNESGLFRKVYEASTTPPSVVLPYPFRMETPYGYTGTGVNFLHMTGVNDKWHAPLPLTNFNQHRDSDGRWYELTDNGDKPSGIQYL